MCIVSILAGTFPSLPPYPYMDNGWDHTENEDKVLLNQSWDLGQVKDQDMQVTSVRTMANTKDGCSDNMDRRSGGYDLVSLSDEYGKHLLSVVLNKVNQIPISNSSFLLFFNWIFSINFDDYFFDPIDILYSFIVSIYNDLDSLNSSCKCTCKCEPRCTGDFICFCLCNPPEPKPSNSYSICVCKHKHCSCNCICICVCEKSENCCCVSGIQHTCNKSFVKVDVGTLINDTDTILYYLNCIRCYISRLENKSPPSSNGRCCSCSCSIGGCNTGSCEPYCCCNQATINHSSIITRIHFIEFLLKHVSKEIFKLQILMNALSLISSISQSCKKSNCKDMIDSLIDYIESGLHYYYLFGYGTEGIRSFVEYKFNYNKFKQIISSLEKSVKPLLNQLDELISEILGNPDYTIIASKMLINVYSQYSAIHCYDVINRMMEFWTFSDESVGLFKYIRFCLCALGFETKHKGDRPSGFPYPLHTIRTSDVNPVSEMVSNTMADNVGNHLCLCLVIKYHMRPTLLKCILYLRNEELGTLDTLSRKFHMYNRWSGLHSDLWKFCALVLTVIYELTSMLRNRYRKRKYCLCMNIDHRYYNYFVSIILSVSSLVENTWSMDHETTRMSIERLSTLYAQLEIYDLNSTRLKPFCYNPVYSLIVNKECKQQLKDKCCCCWCVTCYNLGIILIYLCLQFKLNKAIGGKKDCEYLKKWFELEDCQCKCPQGNGMCCLLKLSSCSQAPSTKADDCKSLEQVLKECCTACSDGENGCCKKLKEKLASGLCKVLLLGCGSNCSTDAGTGEFKVKCLFFNNPWGCTSVAVVVFCKCTKAGNECCCLYQLIDNLKSKLGSNLEKICQDGHCVCDDLKSFCNDICTADCATNCGKDCPCKDLKGKLDSICKANGSKCGASECLCKLITQTIGKCFKDGSCNCKNKGCCKVLGASIRILARACKSNVLEPYKRITIDLLNCGKDKTQLIRSIVNRINNGTINRISSLKISCSSYPNLNTKNTVKSRNWGYDTLHEHELTPDNGFTDAYGYPNLSHSDGTRYDGKSNKMFKLVLSRLLVATIVVFMFVYLRISYQQILLVQTSDSNLDINQNENLDNVTENTNVDVVNRSNSSYLVDMLIQNSKNI